MKSCKKISSLVAVAVVLILGPRNVLAVDTPYFYYGVNLAHFSVEHATRHGSVPEPEFPFRSIPYRLNTEDADLGALMFRLGGKADSTIAIEVRAGFGFTGDTVNREVVDRNEDGDAMLRDVPFPISYEVVTTNTTLDYDLDNLYGAYLCFGSENFDFAYLIVGYSFLELGGKSYDGPSLGIGISIGDNSNLSFNMELMGYYRDDDITVYENSVGLNYVFF